MMQALAADFKTALGRRLAFLDTLQSAQYFDRGRTEKNDLAPVWSSAVGQGTYGAHDMLGIPRLEKVDRVERALRVSEKELKLLGRGRRRVVLRWLDRAR